MEHEIKEIEIIDIDFTVEDIKFITKQNITKEIKARMQKDLSIKTMEFCVDLNTNIQTKLQNLLNMDLSKKSCINAQYFRGDQSITNNDDIFDLYIINLTNTKGNFTYNDNKFKIEKNKCIKLAPNTTNYLNISDNPDSLILILGPFNKFIMEYCYNKYEYYLTKDDAINRKNIIGIGYNLEGESLYLGHYTKNYVDVYNYNYWAIAPNTKQETIIKPPKKQVFSKDTAYDLLIDCWPNNMYFYVATPELYNKYSAEFDEYYYKILEYYIC